MYIKICILTRPSKFITTFEIFFFSWTCFSTVSLMARHWANRLKGWFHQLLVITMASEGTSSACMWKPVALMKKVLMKPLWGREAVWPSGFGHSIWNLEVPGSNPSPYCYLDLFLVVPSSTPRLRCGNSRWLVSLPPVRILNSLCSIWNIQLLI